MTAINLPAPHAGQARVIREAAGAGARYVVVECGRRWGKTMMGLAIVAGSALNGGKAGWFVPSYKYFELVWRQLIERLGPATKRQSKTEGFIELVTGGLIEVWSLHNNEDAGRSRDYDVVVIDEAAYTPTLREAWPRAIRPTLTDRQGKAYFFSTPAGYEFFHELFERGESDDYADWISFRMGTASNPHIPPQEIEDARREYTLLGLEDVFNQEFLGIPAPDGGNPFGLDHINVCVSDSDVGTSQPIAWGIDLGKSQDWTVVIGITGSGCVGVFDRWRRIPWDETKRRCARHIGAQKTLVDSTGLGDPIVESLQRDHQCQGVEPYTFTAQSKQKLMEGLAQAIQSHSISFPEGEITRELRTFRYEVSTTTRRVKYSAPEGLHDDCVMALALAVEAWRTFVPVSIQTFAVGAKPKPDPKLRRRDDEGVKEFYDRMRTNPNWGFPVTRGRW